MSDMTFGLVMTFMGMGVTLLSLLLLMLVINIMNRIYPFRPEETNKPK